MCRNIKTLFNFEPPATEDEINASALQFVRKLSGFNKPSQANAAAFELAVDEVARAARKLLTSLHTHAPARAIGNFRDRAIECLGIGLRRRVEPGKLAHELQRGGVDFGPRCRRLEIEQRLDVAAHEPSPLPAPALSKDERRLQNPTCPAILAWIGHCAPFGGTRA